MGYVEIKIITKFQAAALNAYIVTALAFSGQRLLNTVAQVSWLTVFANKQLMLASTFDLDTTTMARQRRKAQLTKPSRKPPPRCKTGSCSGGPRRTFGPSRTRTRVWVPLRALHHAQPCQPPRQQQRRRCLRPRPLRCCSNPPFFLSKPLLLCQCVSPRDRRRSQHRVTFTRGFNRADCLIDGAEQLDQGPLYYWRVNGFGARARIWSEHRA